MKSYRERTDPHLRLLPPELFDGPIRKRKCTDVLGFVLLVGCWICAGIIAHQAKKNGDINIILHPFDYDARPCGVGIMKNHPYLYPLRYDGTGVCVRACPTKTNVSHIFACVGTDFMPSYLLNTTNDVPALVDGMLGYCMFQISTFEMDNYCFVDDPDYEEEFPPTAGLIAEALAPLTDLWYTRVYTLIFGFSSILIFYLHVVFLHWRKTATVTIWAAITLVFFSLVHFGVIWVFRSPSSTTPENVLIENTAGIVSICVAFIWLGWALYIRSSINLAKELIREAACALTDMPSLLVLPIFQGAVWAGFFVAWFVSVLWISANGYFVLYEPPNDVIARQVYHQNEHNKSEIGFLVFVLIWTSLFILAFSDLVVSHATAQWYFTRDKTQQSCCVVPGSFLTILFYHFGTAVIGSICVTLVYPFRDFLVWMDKKMKVCCGSASQVLYCCLCFVLFMTHHFFRFWTKHAYVLTALFSQEFFKSSKTSFFLIERNLSRASLLFAVCEYLVIILVLSISFTSTVIFYYVVKLNLGTRLDEMVLPTAVMFGLSFLVSTMCVEILGMAARSIFVCFFADSEMFRPGDRYVDPSLARFMTKGDLKPETFSTPEDERNKLVDSGQSKQYGAATAV